MWSFLRDHNYKVGKHATSNMIFAAFAMMVSVFAYGFDTAVLGTVQAMDEYERVFGTPDGQGGYEFSSAHLAYLNSFPLITYGIGVIGASFLGERFGRKIVFYTMNCICLAGVFMTFFGRTYAVAIVGRMVIQLHVGAEAWLVPMWLAEIVPSNIRGSMVACYAFSHIFAGFISSVITNSTSRLEGNDTWLIPIGCMFTFPALSLLLSFLLPESPRWLLRKGKYQKAVDNIFYLNSADPNYPAEAEAQLIMDAMENTPTKGEWRDLFRGTNNRRTWIGILASFATQGTGQAFASVYGTVFLKRLNVIDPFTGTMIKRAGLLGGCLFVITMVDRIGRRRTAVIVGGLCAACLYVMGGLDTINNKTPAINNGILSMTIIFPCFYMVGFGSTMQIIKAELPHTSLRDKSNMIFWTVANVSNFVVTFTVPYLIDALSAQVGFVYGSLSLACVILIWFFVPEMTGRSLEEVDEMFEAKVPAWRSRSFVPTGQGAALTQLENNHKRPEELNEKLAVVEPVVEHVEPRRD